MNIEKTIKESNIEAKLTSHLLDDVKLDGGSVRFVVDGQKGDAAFMLSDNGISCDNASTARLTASFGSYRHTNLANAMTKFGTLQRILLQTYQKVCIVISYTTVSLGKTFNGNVKVLMSGDFVAHQLTQMLGGTCRFFLFQDTLSSLSCHDRSLRSRHVYPLPNLLLEGSDDNCQDGTLARRARHDSPYQDTWSDWRGSLLYLQSSFSFDVIMFAAKIQHFFESTKVLVAKFVLNDISYSNRGVSYKLRL